LNADSLELLPVKVSGFTFVRNAIKLQYPIVESIRSILPIVDEFVVNVGDSEDDTDELIRSIGSPKLRILRSTWNPNVTTGGYVLAQQTNIALLNCTGEWAIYLQADEAIHERDHDALVRLMARYRTDEGVEGLLLERLTFYGGYNIAVVAHPFLYDLACRVVKPHQFVLSRGDAAGFAVHPKYKERGRRLRAVDTGLTVFHYGDVRAPAVSADFQDEKEKFWLETGAENKNYYDRIAREFVTEYCDTHPEPMHGRIRNWISPVDLGSPQWHSVSTAFEYRRYWRSRLIKLIGRRDIFPSISNNYKIVASHRDSYVYQKP
jgi:glycosyltransferase involved in cell wall biosynthesis